MPSKPALPITLSEITARGLVARGTVAARAVFFSAAGVVIADVLLPAVATRDWTATAPGAAILAALADYGVPVNRQQLIRLSGYEVAGEHFRHALAGLIESGHVVRRGRLYGLPAPHQSAGATQ